MINTNRLLLIPIAVEHVAAICNSRAELSQLIGCTVPDSFPHFRNAFTHMLAHHHEYQSLPGTSWFFIDRAGSKLIGMGGLGDLSDGECELGYEITPEARRMGIATEGCQAIINWAFARDDVSQIIAHTLPVDGDESAGVLKKVGFAFVGDCDDPDTGEAVFRWVLKR